MTTKEKIEYLLDDIETARSAAQVAWRYALKDEGEKQRLIAFADAIISSLLLQIEAKDRGLRTASAAFKTIKNTLMDEGKLMVKIEEDKRLLEYIQGNAELAKARAEL